jgi:hypothetical protein
VRARGLKPLTDAAALLEQVVARNPNYAPAWALLSLAYVLTPNYHPAWVSGAVAETRGLIDKTMPKAELAAQRAIQLDPKDANGYVALAYVQAMRAHLLQAEELFSKALGLDDYNPEALHFYSLLLSGVGRLKDAVAMRQRLQVLEPFVPSFKWNTAHILWVNGQTNDALALQREVPPELAAGQGQWLLVWIYASLGRYLEAADVIQANPAGFFLPRTAEVAARLLRTAPKAAASPQTLPPLGFFQFVYSYVGAESRILDFSEETLEVGYSAPGAVGLLWHPSYTTARKTERFKAFARKAGLVEYWHERGWPPLCHPTTGDDFVCE